MAIYHELSPPNTWDTERERVRGQQSRKQNNNPTYP